MLPEDQDLITQVRPSKHWGYCSKLCDQSQHRAVQLQVPNDLWSLNQHSQDFHRKPNCQSWPIGIAEFWTQLVYSSNRKRSFAQGRKWNIQTWRFINDSKRKKMAPMSLNIWRPKRIRYVINLNPFLEIKMAFGEFSLFVAWCKKRTLEAWILHWWVRLLPRRFWGAFLHIPR